VDAQSRGRADEIDPADQWVLNPQTGDYELRLNQSGPQSTASSSRAPGARRARRIPEAASPAGAGGAPRGRTAAPGAEVPGQRSRRAGEASGGRVPPQAGRRKRKPTKSRKKKVR